MPVNLSIRNVPDDLAEKLRERARAAHRSLQGELLVILEEAVGERRPVTLGVIRERIREYGISTGDEATGMVREDRDAR